MAKKETTNLETLTCLQFCNHTGLIRYDRQIVSERFAEYVGTLSEWQEKLKEIGMIINKLD